MPNAYVDSNESWRNEQTQTAEEVMSLIEGKLSYIEQLKVDIQRHIQKPSEYHALNRAAKREVNLAKAELAKQYYLLGEAYLDGLNSLNNSQDKARFCVEAVKAYREAFLLTSYGRGKLEQGYRVNNKKNPQIDTAGQQQIVTLLEQDKMTLALCHLYGIGFERNPETAFQYMQQAAEQGNAFGQYNLGWMYHHGLGVEQNYPEAIKWYRVVAEQGNALAQNNLGYMHHQGLGVEQNHQEAIRLFTLAAEQGNVFAQTNLGCMYHQGLGVEQNHQEAIRLFTLAAEQGYACAQNNLGRMYYYGLGVGQNYPEAIKWYRLAAEQGNVLAQSHLGYMYHQGLGVEQNYPEAIRLYTLAAEQGDALALTNLENLYNREGKTYPLAFARSYRRLVPQLGEKATAKLREIVESIDKQKISPNPTETLYHCALGLNNSELLNKLIHSEPGAIFSLIKNDKLLTEEEKQNHLSKATSLLNSMHQHLKKEIESSPGKDKGQTEHFIQLLHLLETKNCAKVFEHVQVGIKNFQPYWFQKKTSSVYAGQLTQFHAICINDTEKNMTALFAMYEAWSKGRDDYIITKTKAASASAQSAPQEQNFYANPLSLRQEPPPSYSVATEEKKKTPTLRQPLEDKGKAGDDNSFSKDEHQHEEDDPTPSAPPAELVAKFGVLQPHQLQSHLQPSTSEVPLAPAGFLY